MKQSYTSPEISFENIKKLVAPSIDEDELVKKQAKKEIDPLEQITGLNFSTHNTDILQNSDDENNGENFKKGNDKYASKNRQKSNRSKSKKSHKKSKKTKTKSKKEARNNHSDSESDNEMQKN